MVQQPAIDISERFRGALLGLAVGDALGAPLEFQPPRAPHDYLTEMSGGGWLQLAPGEWTDDTQMTLCGVESLLERRVFDPDDIANRFVLWAQSQPKDIGNHTSHVLSLLERGVRWEQASLSVQAANPSSASNGSLMRCAPLALFLYRHPEFIEHLAPVFSRITHAHPDCEFACVFHSVALVWLLRGGGIEDAIRTADEVCAGATPEFHAAIDRARQPQNETSPTGYVLDTIEVAVWALLHTRTFEAALLAAVNRGADADTVGAVLGSLAGACYGLRGIPSRWLAPLKERARLTEYADKLLEIANAY